LPDSVIASRLGVCVKTVLHARQRLGIPSTYTNKIPPETTHKIIDMRLDRPTMSAEKIAAKCGVSAESVRAILRREGLSARIKESPYQKAFRERRESEQDEARAMVELEKIVADMPLLVPKVEPTKA
jgi:hypothetical protein